MTGTLDQQRLDYNAGWRYSASPSASLDRLDARGASDATYDGYADQAVGRPKWHDENGTVRAYAPERVKRAATPEQARAARAMSGVSA